MSECYILQGHTPVPASIIQWMDFLRNANRHVALTDVSPTVQVSTVFLGDGHTLFETMVFGGSHDQDYNWVRRYDTWDEAEQGHYETVVLLEAEDEAELVAKFKEAGLDCLLEDKED